MSIAIPKAGDVVTMSLRHRFKFNDMGRWEQLADGTWLQTVNADVTIATVRASGETWITYEPARGEDRFCTFGTRDLPTVPKPFGLQSLVVIGRYEVTRQDPLARRWA